MVSAGNSPLSNATVLDAVAPLRLMLPPGAVSVPSIMVALPSLMLPPGRTDRLAPCAMESVSAPLMVIEPRSKAESLLVA